MLVPLAAAKRDMTTLAVSRQCLSHEGAFGPLDSPMRGTIITQNGQKSHRVIFSATPRPSLRRQDPPEELAAPCSPLP
ncbi:hypothetical protein GCM10009799_00530 [Nocardiopsis rhodophaea]|uniref:Uncharacterized protein n=1 Tax=Nocardiopsis rhodophaea TaxID=280238 RepID=A0ABN2S2L4_9ACTN